MCNVFGSLFVSLFANYFTISEAIIMCANSLSLNRSMQCECKHTHEYIISSYSHQSDRICSTIIKFFSLSSVFGIHSFFLAAIQCGKLQTICSFSNSDSFTSNKTCMHMHTSMHSMQYQKKKTSANSNNFARNISCPRTMIDYVSLLL